MLSTNIFPTAFQRNKDSKCVCICMYVYTCICPGHKRLKVNSYSTSSRMSAHWKNSRSWKQYQVHPLFLLLFIVSKPCLTLCSHGLQCTRLPVLHISWEGSLSQWCYYLCLIHCLILVNKPGIHSNNFSSLNLLDLDNAHTYLNFQFTFPYSYFHIQSQKQWENLS